MRYEGETSISLNPDGIRPPGEAVRYVSYARKLLGLVMQECETNDIPSLFKSHNLSDGTKIRVGKVYEQAYITITTIGGEAAKTYEQFFRFKIIQEYVGEIRGDESILYQIKLWIRNQDEETLADYSMTYGPGTDITGPYEWSEEEECFQLKEEFLEDFPEETVYLFAENQDNYGVIETQHPDIIKQSEWYQEENGVRKTNAPTDDEDDHIYEISLPYIVMTKTGERFPTETVSGYFSPTHRISEHSIVSSRDWLLTYLGVMRNIVSVQPGSPCSLVIDPSDATPIWFGVGGGNVAVVEGWSTMDGVSSLNGIIATATDSAVTVNTSIAQGPTGPAGVTETITDVWDIYGADTVCDFDPPHPDPSDPPCLCIGPPPFEIVYRYTHCLGNAYYANHFGVLPSFDTT